MWCSRFLRVTGKVLYSEYSTLPKDFFFCCADYMGITFHEKMFIGVRDSQQRGLFYGTHEDADGSTVVSRGGDTARELPANTPIATIPLRCLYTTSNIQHKPNALPHVSMEDVRNAIRDEEFKMMAPQLYLGLQFSAIIAALPDISTAKTSQDVTRISEVLRGSANPWARMLDDEDYNEEFVFAMYGMALDSWQRSSYSELTTKFHRSITAVHEAVKPPFKLEHMRRITRLILARAEHTPPLDYYDGSALARRWSRRWRRLCKKQDPSEVSMVPLLDLVNHSNRPNCGIQIGPSTYVEKGQKGGGKPMGGGAITLFTLSKVCPGDELCRHYNFAISRPNALFRYGFLPFDLITVVDNDAANEHYFSHLKELRPEAEERLEKERKMAEEVTRLESLYKQARRQ